VNIFNDIGARLCGRGAPVPGRSNVERTGGMDFSRVSEMSALLRPGRAHSDAEFFKQALK
jgi:hypothetical protein